MLVKGGEIPGNLAPVEMLQEESEVLVGKG